MQFNLEKSSSGNMIQHREKGTVTINGERYQNSIIVFPDKIIANWPVDNVSNLNITALQAIIEVKPEVFLLGTGDSQIFPPMSLRAELARINRSVDVMDTAAACRTYNVLVAEFRQVVVALILP